MTSWVPSRDDYSMRIKQILPCHFAWHLVFRYWVTPSGLIMLGPGFLPADFNPWFGRKNQRFWMGLIVDSVHPQATLQLYLPFPPCFPILKNRVAYPCGIVSHKLNPFSVSLWHYLCEGFVVWALSTFCLSFISPAMFSWTSELSSKHRQLRGCLISISAPLSVVIRSWSYHQSFSAISSQKRLPL